VKFITIIGFANDTKQIEFKIVHCHCAQLFGVNCCTLIWRTVAGVGVAQS
jgi:hypothetical protein